MAPTLCQIKKMRPEILEIAGKHGAYNIRIFGSVARGDTDETSLPWRQARIQDDGMPVFGLIGHLRYRLISFLNDDKLNSLKYSL